MTTRKNKLTISLLVAVLIMSVGSAFARPRTYWARTAADFNTLITYLTVACINNSTGPISSWHWDFGDGSTSNQQNPTHVYSGAGSYRITLTVSQNRWRTDSTSKFVSVSSPPVGSSPPVILPTASFAASPTSGEAPLTVSFVDNSSKATGWLWKFGDGSISTTQSPVHVYAQSGTFTPTLTTTNDAGQDSVNGASILVIEAASSPTPTTPSSLTASSPIPTTPSSPTTSSISIPTTPSLPPPSSTGSVYYVDSANGSDSASGLSVDNAWKTVNKVNHASFNPGDEILFKRGGVWQEQLTLPSSGNSGNPIVFSAYGSGDKPQILNYGISIPSKQYVVIDNLAVKNSNGIGINVNSGSNITIQNCDVSYSWQTGIYFNGTDNANAKSNTVYYAGMKRPISNTLEVSGIGYDGVVGGACSGNVVSYSGRSNYCIFGSFSRTWGNITIDHNESHHSGQSGDHGYGFQIYGTKQTGVGLVICYNYSHDEGNMNLYFSDNVQSPQVYYNILANPGLNGAVENCNLGGDNVNGVSYNIKAPTFYNNIFYMPAKNSGDNWFNVRISYNLRFEGAVFKNNIFYNAATAGDCRFVYDSVTHSSPPVFDNNCYYSTNMWFRFMYENISYAAWNTFKSSTGQESNGINTDPGFVNPGTDFHIKSTSPCINAGVNVGLTKDYDDTPVPQQNDPDIGAHEYQ